MLRISWRPQVAILSISYAVRRIYLSITLARWGAKMLPRCSDLLASTAKASFHNLHPKQPLKRYERQRRESRHRRAVPMWPSSIRSSLLVSVAQHFVINKGVTTACPRGCGSVKPSEHFRGGPNRQTRKPLSAVEHFAPRRANSMMS